MADGEVYLTGRTKDIIIRAGRHIYPQEIEDAVAGIPDIRRGGVAMFGTADQTSGTERIVVLAETAESDPATRAGLRTRAQQVASDIAVLRSTTSSLSRHGPCRGHRVGKSARAPRRSYTKPGA